MKDRTSKYPGRVQLVPVEGMANTYTLSWADEPLQEGTPLNKATLLSDTVAAALRLSGEDPTVSDALGAIATGFGRVTSAQRPPTQEDVGKPGDMWVDLTHASSQVYNLYLCVSELGSIKNIWWAFKSVQRVLKTFVATTSTEWTVPGNMAGEARVVVMGGGGGGASNAQNGGGGGGGRYAEWMGLLSPGDSYSITIGSGGPGGAYQNNGSAGGSTSFGALVSAAGGSGAVGTTGGNGGSGGGSGKTSSVIAVGENFGNGGNISSNAEQGVDTTSFDIDDLGKGTGSAGSTSSGGGGGGGGYGGKGGNGGAYGGGGGGGFGASGNGGNGPSSHGDGNTGGYAAGGGGIPAKYTSHKAGSGGSGVCMIIYYIMEVVA